jgi:hypothetical protein
VGTRGDHESCLDPGGVHLAHQLGLRYPRAAAGKIPQRRRSHVGQNLGGRRDRHRVNREGHQCAPLPTIRPDIVSTTAVSSIVPLVFSQLADELVRELTGLPGDFLLRRAEDSGDPKEENGRFLMENGPR